MRLQNTADYLLGTAPGESVVLVDGERRHTYAELRACTAALADRLETLDLPPGSPVALLAPNGLFWIAAYLATLRRGLVVVPLSTSLTAEEIRARTAWVGARAVFLSRLYERRMAAGLPTGLPFVGESAMHASTAAHAHRCRAALGSPGLDAPGFDATEVGSTGLGAAPVDADDDAAYLFTSGTTGHPRAVRITHRNIQANTESILGFLPIDATDRVLVVLPFTYVFGASVLHTHLRAGATLVNQRAVAYPETTAAMLEGERCTGLAGVPSVFQVLLRNSSFPRRALPHLRTIQQAGGSLCPSILDELRATTPQAQVFVMYGATEATARLAYLPPSELEARPGSIGRAIPGVSLRVVKEDGSPARPGEVGEIYARGANISPGYLNDDESTARRMPAGELHTGDLARIDQDGYLYVVDRAEDFIKTWGHRVASQDVEAVAIQLPDLVAAAAVGVADDQAGERIALAVVLRSGSAITADEILAHCRRQLSRHMVPSSVHVLDALPHNCNGKVLKREIRSLVGTPHPPLPVPAP